MLRPSSGAQAWRRGCAGAVQDIGQPGSRAAAVSPTLQGTTAEQSAMTPLACFSTCPDAATAERIAHALVEERLAACVNLLPGVRSVYRWDGDVVVDEEVLMMIKTTSDRLPTLRERLPALHPFDVPELIALPASDGLPAYLQWIAESTRSR